MPLPALSTIEEDFSFLDDWEDRYRYLIELGRTLDPLPEAERTEANRVRGCVSQVWLATHEERGNGDIALVFHADSDAHIVRGLVALALAIYSGKRPSEILAIDAAEIFNRFGLAAHLTPQRANGVRALIERIRRDAKEAKDRSSVANSASN